jgi:hypothetical protein
MVRLVRKVNSWLTIPRDEPVLVWWAELPNSPPPMFNAVGKPIAKKHEPEQYAFNFAH